MNKARQRNTYTLVEFKYRNREAHKVQVAFNVFTGFYK